MYRHPKLEKLAILWDIRIVKCPLCGANIERRIAHGRRNGWYVEGPCGGILRIKFEGEFFEWDCPYWGCGHEGRRS